MVIQKYREKINTERVLYVIGLVLLVIIMG